MRFREFLRLLASAARRCWRKDSDLMAAAIAFEALLSMAPLTLLLLSTASRFFGTSSARQELLAAADRAMGSTARDLSAYLLDLVPRVPGSGLTAVAGLAVMIYFSSSVFRRVRKALNAIWGLPPPEGIRPALRDWLSSLILVFAAVSLVMGVLALSLAVSLLGPVIVEILPRGALLMRLLNFGISFTLLTGVLIGVLMRGPQVRLRVKDVAGAALLTASLYALANLILSHIIWKSVLASLYGAAGALIVILLWIYYSTHILLFGAAYSREDYERRGGRITPRE